MYREARKTLQAYIHLPKYTVYKLNVIENSSYILFPYNACNYNIIYLNKNLIRRLLGDYIVGVRFNKFDTFSKSFMEIFAKIKVTTFCIRIVHLDARARAHTATTPSHARTHACQTWSKDHVLIHSF